MGIGGTTDTAMDYFIISPTDGDITIANPLAEDPLKTPLFEVSLEDFAAGIIPWP